MVGLGLGGVGEDADVHAQCLYDVATGLFGLSPIGLVGINIFIVPGLGVSIFGSVAGVVKPVGPIDGAHAVEDIGHCLGGGGGEVLFCYIGCHVMAFLAPCHSRQGGGYRECT